MTFSLETRQHSGIDDHSSSLETVIVVEPTKLFREKIGSAGPKLTHLAKPRLTHPVLITADFAYSTSMAWWKPPLVCRCALRCVNSTILEMIDTVIDAGVLCPVSSEKVIASR